MDTRTSGTQDDRLSFPDGSLRSPTNVKGQYTGTVVVKYRTDKRKSSGRPLREREMCFPGSGENSEKWVNSVRVGHIEFD